MNAPTNSPADVRGDVAPLRDAVGREPERHRRVEMRAAELPDRVGAGHDADRPAEGDDDPAAVLGLRPGQQRGRHHPVAEQDQDRGPDHLRTEDAHVFSSPSDSDLPSSPDGRTLVHLPRRGGEAHCPGPAASAAACKSKVRRRRSGVLVAHAARAQIARAALARLERDGRLHPLPRGLRRALQRVGQRGAVGRGRPAAPRPPAAARRASSCRPARPCRASARRSRRRPAPPSSPRGRALSGRPRPGPSAGRACRRAARPRRRRWTRAPCPRP